MRGLSALRVALLLPPAAMIAACSADAREEPSAGYQEPSTGYEEPSSAVLSGAGTDMELVATYNSRGGVSARHRPSAGTCGNDHPYDFCFDDGKCATGGPCLCGGRPDSYGWNICLDGNCTIDGDCGEAGRCSPTLDPCDDSHISGQYCHTPEDECDDDTDCLSGVHCKYVEERGRWACAGTSGCPIVDF